MRAAVLREYGTDLAIEDVDLDDPAEREVRIRVAASGVCHSDRTAQQGGQRPALPTVLGHEVAGTVEAVGGEVRGLRPGDHVATCSVAPCGECRWCLSGNPQHCTRRRRSRPQGEPPRMSANGETIVAYVGLGGFAEEVLVHESAVSTIPPEMPLDRACLLGCAVVTGVGAITRSADVQPGQTVAVIGCGGVGLNALQAARMRGAERIIAVDVVPEKLAMARAFGATDLVDGSSVNPVDAVKELTGGGVDHALEVVGRPATIEQAFAMLGPMGIATSVGVTRIGDVVQLPAGELMLEKRLQGSKMGRTQFKNDAGALSKMYLEGELLLDELISSRAPLEGVNDALRALDDGKQARTVLTFEA
ncbi:MAG: Zn-dependent alcohol dehydrogenase [Solirubrobacterales bacterium]